MQRSTSLERSGDALPPDHPEMTGQHDDNNGGQNEDVQGIEATQRNGGHIPTPAQEDQGKLTNLRYASGDSRAHRRRPVGSLIPGQ